MSSLFPVVRNIGERAIAKTYSSVSLSSIVRKILEKLLNDRFVDSIRKFGFLYDFLFVILQIFSQGTFIKLQDLLIFSCNTR